MPYMRGVVRTISSVWPKGNTMTKDELVKFLTVVEQVRAANTASPEAARAFLEEAGYLNRDGSVAAPYKSAQSSPNR
jgi:hypothetical protein